MTDTVETTPLLPQYVNTSSATRVMDLSLIHVLSAETPLSTRLKAFFSACFCCRRCYSSTTSPTAASPRSASPVNSSTDSLRDISLTPSQSAELDLAAAAAAVGVNPEVLKEQRRKEEEEQIKREAEQAAKKTEEEEEAKKRERDEWRRQQAEEFAAIMNRFRDQSLYWGY